MPNPIAAIALCFLVHAYDLAAALVMRLTETQVTVGLLMQVDKLVQLLESPVFLDARMGLLTPAAPGTAPLLQACVCMYVCMYIYVCVYVCIYV